MSFSNTNKHKYTIFVWLSLVVITSLSVCQGQDTSSFEEWRAHVTRVKPAAFPCQDPQPRTFHVKDILGDENWNEVKNLGLTPLRTILHTCFSAGACKNTESCKPTKEHDVVLTFGYFVGNAMKYVIETAKNHTECACQSDKLYPK